MGFFSSIWNGLVGGLESILRLYEGLLEPIAGGQAWGLSIILLTVTVRLFLIPLMVRQTKSMRSMQKIQPELKRIKEKYKADRSMMKTDPERYKKLKEKEREAQMALYQEHSVNPVGGCLPLILQMPIFFALFRLLEGASLAADLETASFLGIPSLTGTAREILTPGDGGVVMGAAIGAAVLILLQVGTTFYSQKQMQARNATAGMGGDQAQAQKMLMYIMPVFLGYLSFTFPIGVVLYWVTTNVWTIGQQFFIFRSVEREEARAAEERKSTRKATPDAAAGKDRKAGDGELSPKRSTTRPSSGVKANGSGNGTKSARTRTDARQNGATNGRSTTGSSAKGATRNGHSSAGKRTPGVRKGGTAKDAPTTRGKGSS